MKSKALRLLCTILLLAGLPGCGSDSSRALADLNSEDLEIRKEAIRELILAPNSTDEVISALNGMIGARDVEVRRLAVTALGKVGADSKLAREGLTLALEDSNRTIQFASAKILLEYDAANNVARKVVLTEIKNTNPRAMLLVSELKTDGRWAAPTLRQLVRHRDESVRALAKTALENVSTE